MLLHAKDVTAITNPGFIEFAQFAKVFPRLEVAESLEQSGRPTFRLRELPNDLMFYFPLVMAIRRDGSSSEVLRCILEGQENVFGRRTDKVTGKAGISKGRSRVGWEPLKMVFDKLAVPLAKEGSVGSFYNGLRVMACDGVLLNVADTEKNDEFFDRPTNQSERAGSYPQARVVALVECGTHAIVNAKVGGYRAGEVTLAKEVLSALDNTMLCIADRLFFSWDLFSQSLNTGAALVWRIKQADKDKLKIGRRLPDGSYLAKYYPPERKAKNAPQEAPLSPIDVRLVSYSVSSTERIHLVTTLLDSEEAPAKELAALYMQRWEIELVFKEMKVQLNNKEVALRSQTPDLVLQEVYGLMMAHYAIRSLIYEAAQRAGLDPDALSFISAVRAVRRKSLKGGDFSP